MVVEGTTDRVGIGWRPELAPGILSNLHLIDVVEVIADDLFDAPARELRAIQTLASQVPVVLHGVSLGLASAAPIAEARLERMARVVNAIRPEFWSEHLAFVRGDGVELGHLAAPPRTAATIEGTARNVQRTLRVVGSAPRLENVASLIEPPGSTCDEASWASRVLDAAGGELLLDLNNLYANALNFGYEPRAFLQSIPVDKVTALHLAGGKWIRSADGARRLLDDHLHDVPDAVYQLLTNVAARGAPPLTVILERDGAYPPFESLLGQLARARASLASGREQAVGRCIATQAIDTLEDGSLGGGQAFEAFLARLYVDAEARRRFLLDPRSEAERAGLDSAAREAFAQIDRVGLELAAHGFAAKRRQAATRRGVEGRLSALLRRWVPLITDR